MNDMHHLYRYHLQKGEVWKVKDAFDFAPPVDIPAGGYAYRSRGPSFPARVFGSVDSLAALEAIDGGGHRCDLAGGGMYGMYGMYGMPGACTRVL